MHPSSAAQIFTSLTIVVMVFQACLVAGMPWGQASMGGKFPGKYPPNMRWVALINMLVLAFLACIVLIRADLLFPQFMEFAKIGIWFVLLFCFVGTILNTITPSKIERIWAPVLLIQFITALIIALS